jgi:glycosyltransferase involved in cell wall biosynthesis
MNKIVFFIKNLNGGGAEKTILNLASYLSISFHVILLTWNDKTVYDKNSYKGIKFINLKNYCRVNPFFALYNYIKEEKPKIIISSLYYANIQNIIVKILLKKSRHIAVTTLHGNLKMKINIFSRIMFYFINKLYYFSDYIITNSKGIAYQLQNILPRLDPNKVLTIYNPIYSQIINTMSKQSVTDSYLVNSKKAYIITACRFNKFKRLDILIKSFYEIRKKHDINLVILGDGKYHEVKKIKKIISKLNLAQNIYMPGFVSNPYKYIYNSSCFVFTSEYESLPTIIVEALGLETTIVSTNCDYGPSEILDNGKYGILTPVNDYIAISKAVIAVLEKKIIFNNLIERAKYFSIKNSGEEYIKLISYILG